jgi:hypothetical protein
MVADDFVIVGRHIRSFLLKTAAIDLRFQLLVLSAALRQ